MLDRTSLARQATADNCCHDVELIFGAGNAEWLAQDHLENRAREISVHFLAIDHDPARSGLDPDAGDGIFSLARGVGTTQRIANRLAGRGFGLYSARGDCIKILQCVDFVSHQ